MIEKLENDSSLFEQLVLSKNQYVKGRISSSEILFNGNMYDIKSMVFAGDSVHLSVINDVREKEIVDIIEKLVNSSTSANKKIPLQLQVLILLKYLPASFSLDLNPPVFQMDKCSQSEPEFQPNNPEILTPPPRLV